MNNLDLILFSIKNLINLNTNKRTMTIRKFEVRNFYDQILTVFLSRFFTVSLFFFSFERSLTNSIYN